MSAYAARCRRAQELMVHLGVDWVFVGVSSDLQYLTGYEAHPLTRLTLFMLPQDGRGTMIMPSFEAVRLEREGLDVFYDVKPWIETENPIDLVVGTAGSAPVTVAIGAQLWGMFLIPIQDALSSASRYY